MKDVAALAGVSPKTVSNVITGAAHVRGQTRERVESAMQELDFVPNLSARGLRNGRTGVIGVALPDLATAFSASITQRIVEAAHERGLVVQLEETAADPSREYDLLYRARTHLIDGLILNPVRLEDSVVEHVAHLPPIVLIGEVEQHRTDRVYINSRAAGRAAAEHLIARGARRIVTLGGTESELAAGKATLGQRLQGCLEVLEESGIPAYPELQVGVPGWTIAGGAAGVRALLDRAVPFDAIMAFTDSIAMGALHALEEAGVRTPEDVLVSGFDDVEHAAFTRPSLTTIRFDHDRYMRAALDLLSSRIDDRSVPPRAEEIPFELVVRGSTRPGPRGWEPAA